MKTDCRIALLSACLCAVIVSVVSSAPARAIDVPAAGGLGIVETPDDEGKRLVVVLGYAYGTDSNYDYAATGTPQSFSQMSGAVIVRGGNNLWSTEFAYELDMDSYSTTGESILRRNRAVFSAGKHGEKLLFGIRGVYSGAEHVHDIDFPTGITLQRLAYMPEVTFSTGKTEFGLSYAADRRQYDQKPEIDHKNSSTAFEFRWWKAETNQLFFHYDTGAVVYDTPGFLPGFDYTRIYGGWRLDAPGRIGLELSLGMQSLDNFTAPASGALPWPSRPFASLRAAFLRGEGTSRLEVTLAMTDEQSATSAYKSVTAAGVRYRRRTTPRFGWTAGARFESAGLVEPYASFPDSLSRLFAEAGASLDVGSLGSMHGRVFANMEYESRSGGNVAAPDYKRLRMLAGIALVF